MFPCFSCIGAFVNSIAEGNIVAHFHFTHSYVKNILIGWGNSNGTDRRRMKSGVAYTNPIFAAVACFPHASAHSACVICEAISAQAGYCQTSSCSKRADVAPFHSAGGILKKRIGRLLCEAICRKENENLKYDQEFIFHQEEYLEVQS